MTRILKYSITNLYFQGQHLLVLKQKALLTDNLSKTVNFARHYISELEKIGFLPEAVGIGY